MSGTTSGNTTPARMRTYGRVQSVGGYKQWVPVLPDAAGNNDSIWLTTLCQVLKLELGESPFYANYGIPARRSVVTQIFPDFYVSQTRQQFAAYFASLIITKQSLPTPTYNIQVIFNSGATQSVTVVPQILLDGDGRPILDGYGNTIIIGQLQGSFVAT